MMENYHKAQIPYMMQDFKKCKNLKIKFKKESKHYNSMVKIKLRKREIPLRLMDRFRNNMWNRC